jgi:RsiW-degrading membrane proteinase PrsW (M82 family)
MRQRTFFRTGWLNIFFQALFLALLYTVEAFALFKIQGAWRTAITWFLVLFPCALWAWFFYLQDRKSPEPSHYIVASFLAGLGAASVFSLPLERDLFRTGEWLYESPIFLFLGSSLIRGTLMSFVIYLLIRYGFYSSREFEEPVDAMVYGAFAGCGFAAITSFSYLGGHSDFTLFATGYTAACNILIYASTGSLAGYLVGRSKFLPEHRHRSHLLAILAGTFLVGLYHVVNELVFLSGWQEAFWLSFGATLVLSAAVLALATRLMRQIARAPAPEPTGRAGSLPVWGLALLLLLAAGLVRHLATASAAYTSQEYGLAFEYPPNRLKPVLLTGISSVPVPLPSIFTAQGFDQGPVGFSVAVKKEGIELSVLDPLAYLRASPPLSISLEQTTVAGRKGIRAKYSYLKRRAISADDFPEIAWVYTDIVPSKNYTYVFTFEGTPSNFREQEKLYRTILDSVQWTTE